MPHLNGESMLARAVIESWCAFNNCCWLFDMRLVRPCDLGAPDCEESFEFVSMIVHDESDRLRTVLITKEKKIRERSKSWPHGNALEIGLLCFDI